MDMEDPDSEDIIMDMEVLDLEDIIMDTEVLDLEDTTITIMAMEDTTVVLAFSNVFRRICVCQGRTSSLPFACSKHGLYIKA
ncbi:hypothetical protein VNI00_011514 [Paramarasmius palmivorus]|uniref:Uncharacterized protein n=1 Tax=Paramarasmius palmivorus TaxID=297713 RepID=A0AAW0CDK7_9AGAR